MKSKARRNAWWVLSSILVGSISALILYYQTGVSGGAAVWMAVLTQAGVTYAMWMANYAGGGGEE